MQDFKMSGTNMNDLLTKLKSIQEDIDDSYDLLSQLLSRIEDDKLWKGKEETTFIEQIVEKDLQEGKNDGRIQTRFPPEQIGRAHV